MMWLSVVVLVLAHLCESSHAYKRRGSNFVSFGRIGFGGNRHVRSSTTASACALETLEPSAWDIRLVSSSPIEPPSIQSQRRMRRGSNSATVASQASLRGTVAPPSSTAVVNADATLLEQRLVAVTQPVISTDIWDSLTGTEFQDNPDRLDALVSTGLQMTQRDESDEWIDWKVFGHQSPLEEGNIHVWTGRTSKDDSVGAGVPFIKTRSIIPLSVSEMVSLLMDSNRVKTYNQWSLGREDCWTSSEHFKIVKNRTKPPLGAKEMVSVTMLHARECNDKSWLVVSRAIGGTAFQEQEDASAGRSDILLGVNFLEHVDDSRCMLTAVTHLYSPAIPSMLAERLGVKSAINFVKDMRKLKESE